MHGMPSASRAMLAALAASASLAASAEPTIAPTPFLPTYGQAVTVDLVNSAPYFLPAMRYVRQGNNIVIDYELAPSEFGPFPPNLGRMPLNLGELPPGNYSVTARFFDVNRSGGPTSSAWTNLPVLPPQQYGVYTVPQQPHAYDDVGITVRSAAYFDPASMHVTVGSGTIRLDFTYDGSLSGAPAPGMQTYGTVSAGRLAPGTYHIEAWARPTTGGTPEKYFARDVTVGSTAVVVEFYNEYIDHYFMTGSSDEITLLDNGGQGGWKRTGQSFAAWPDASRAPLQAKPVCRFYAKGPNSHFYTADPSECAQLKQLESAQRAQAEGSGQPFLGWGYEGIAFYALLPENGQCPAGTSPVWRTYNGRAAQNDSNHRFMVDSLVRSTMAGWTEEGVAFCTPA